MLYSLTNGSYRRPLYLRVLSKSFTALAIAGGVAFALLLIDGFLFESRGLINVIVFIIER